MAALVGWYVLLRSAARCRSARALVRARAPKRLVEEEPVEVALEG